MAEAAWRKYEATKDASWVARAKESGAAALKLSPTLSEVQVTLAIIANGTGEYESAVATLNSVLERDPTNAVAYRELGQAYDALGDTAKAESTFLRAVKARPATGRPTTRSAASTRDISGTPTPPRSSNASSRSRQTTRAAIAISAGCICSSGSGTRRCPRSRQRRSLAHRGFGGRTLRRPISSSSATRRRHRPTSTRRSSSPKDHRLWYNLASVYLWTPGSEAKANAAFARCVTLGEEARKVNPRDQAVFARLAACYAHLGDGEKARAAAADAEKLGTLRGNTRLMLAQAFEQLGDRAQALANVKAAMASGVSREEVESTRSLDALRKDPAYAATRQ